MAAADVAVAVHDGFSGLTEQSNKPLPKFLVHELFVTFFAHLLRKERWELIS
jgi:hypothetical protein